MAKHATGNTTLINQGIIPFGSVDESVLMQCDMKSASSVAAAGGIADGTPTYSESGMTNATDADHVMFGEITGYAKLDVSGQISIDAPIFYLANKEGGFDAALNGYLMSWSDVDSFSSAPFGRILKKSSTDNIQAEIASGDADNITNFSVLDTNSIVTLTLSWNGNTATFYIDGRLIWTTPRLGGVTADHMKYIWVGTLRGLATGLSGLEGYSVSNLIISSRPVMLSHHPILSKVAIIGHSFVATEDPFPTAIHGWDKSIGRSIKGHLARRGLHQEHIFYAESGAALDTTMGVATDLDAEFTSAIASRPTCAYIVAGANDVTAQSVVVGDLFNATTFESEYKRYIDDLAITCSRIVVTTVVTSIGKTSSYTALVRANTLAANGIIKALASYDVSGINPNCEIVVSDLYPLFDERVGQNYWAGEYTGVWDDRHPTAKGCRMIGEDMGNTLYRSLLK